MYENVVRLKMWCTQINNVLLVTIIIYLYLPIVKGICSMPFIHQPTNGKTGHLGPIPSGPTRSPCAASGTLRQVKGSFVILEEMRCGRPRPLILDGFWLALGHLDFRISVLNGWNMLKWASIHPMSMGFKQCQYDSTMLWYCISPISCVRIVFAKEATTTTIVGSFGIMI